MKTIIGFLFLAFAGIVCSTEAYAQSGGGTVIPDTYFQSGRPWCDVRAMGAVGDGFTDDTSAFNKCVTKLQTISPVSGGGGTMLVPAGLYCLKGTVDTSAVNVAITILGTSQQVTLFHCNVDHTVIRLNSGWSKLENLTVWGKGLNWTPNPDGVFGATTPAVLLDTNCVSCKLSHVYLIGGIYPLEVKAADAYIEDIFALGGYGDTTSVKVDAASATAVWFIRAKLDHGFGTGVTTCSPATSTMNVQATFSGTTMAVSSVTSGRVHVGDGLAFAGQTGAPLVSQQTSGTPGGVGNYTVSINQGVIGSAVAVTCVGNNPPAWAASNIYAQDQVVNLGGYYVQASQAGTSGGSTPALQNYNVTINDGTVHWLLASLVAASGFSCVNGCAEISFDHSDFSGMYGGQSIIMNDPTARFLKIENSVISNQLGPFVIYLAQGVGFSVINSEIFGCTQITCPNINIGPSFQGQVHIIGNFIGSSYHAILAQSGKFNVDNNFITNATFGVNVGANVSQWSITSNICANLTTPFFVNSGTSTDFRIWGNLPASVCWTNDLSSTASNSNKIIDYGDGTFASGTWFPWLMGHNKGATITGPTAPGATQGGLAFECGTTAGTAALYAGAGTSNTWTRVLDNIGSGVSGC